MAKFIVCVGMAPGAGGVQEFTKDIEAKYFEVMGDGTLVFRNAGDERIAVFKQYMWCQDETIMPVVKPVRSLHQ